MNYQTEYKLWKNNLTDAVSQKALDAMPLEEIKAAFSQDITFGTAGARELLSLGPNRLNLYTVRKITYGFAKTLLKQHGQKNMSNFGVVVYHDARHQSFEFTNEICRVFSHFKIKTFITDSNKTGTTPFLSYTIRQIRARGGVMITASHNPKEYNGYKAYNYSGAQVMPNDAKEIRFYMAKIKNIFDLEINAAPAFTEQLPDDHLHNYIETVKNIQLNSDLPRMIKIVFTPQHGVSGLLTKQILTESGYTVFPVKEQMIPDPNFTYTKNPNPEAPESYELSLKYAKANNADIIIAVDPDGDRLGIMAKHHDRYILLNGNETAVIMLEYYLSTLNKRHKIPENSVMLNTYVTSHLGDVICKAYGVETYKTPTGFKWMGNLISNPPYSNAEKKFIFGYESSFGYLVHDFVRDKDGSQAAVVIAEACNYYKQQNKSLLDVLNEINRKYGYFYDYDFAFTFSGLTGHEKMEGVMDILRTKSIKRVADFEIVKKENYLDHPPIALYRNNLVKLYFSNGSWVAIRPSGTEPKLKVYICNTGLPLAELKLQNKKIKDAIMNFIN